MSSFGYNVLGFGSSATVGSGSYGSTAVEIGTMPNTANGVYYALAVSPNFSESNVVYALRSTASANGAFDILKSTDASENWSTQISGQTGNGSAYGFDILAISDSVVVVQHRADLFRSTNSGANLTHISNLSGGGQNNWGFLSWDGTYGMVPGYVGHYSTANSFQSVTSRTTTNYLMASAPLSSDGSNVFLKVGFGSSGSPKSINTTNNTAGTLSNIQTTPNAEIQCASDPHTSNVYFAKCSKTNNDFFYATYSSVTMTAMNSGGSGNASGSNFTCDVTNNGTMVYAMSDGLYYYNIGGTHTKFSTETTVNSVQSLDTDTNSIQFVLQNGKVYGIDLPTT